MKFRILGMLAAASVAFSGAALAESKTAGERTDDITIAGEVKAHLVDAKGVPGTDVNVEVYKGVVLLSGFVTQQSAKDAAGKAAAEVKHVTKVHNAISIAPETSMGEKLDDTTLVGKVKAALIDEKNVDANSINVEARGGVVQLGGFVSNSNEKSLAIKTAQGVKGAKRVDDALYIKP